MTNEKKFHVGIKTLILNERNEILVLKINPEECKGDDSVYWDLPGGRIEENDSIEDTIKKEVEEELGIGGDEVEVIRPFEGSIANIKIPVGDEIFGLVLITYLCKMKNTKKEIKLSFEHTDYKWASVDEAKKLLSHKFNKSFIDKLDELK